MNNLQPDALFHKPLGIVAAKNLLYTSIFLEIVTWTIGRLSFPNAPATTTNQTLITLIISVIVIFTLTKCVTRGMKWARVALLVLLLVGLIPVVRIFGDLWQASPLLGVMTLLQTILEAFAISFLFRQESTIWFNRVKENAKEAPRQ